jgi:hypothetical protein
MTAGAIKVSKETYYVSKETYYVSKETYYVSKETYYVSVEYDSGSGEHMIFSQSATNKKEKKST